MPAIIVRAAVPHCRSTQQIVEHFTNCKLTNCPVCPSTRQPSSDKKDIDMSTKASDTGEENSRNIADA